MKLNKIEVVEEFKQFQIREITDSGCSPHKWGWTG